MKKFIYLLLTAVLISSCSVDKLEETSSQENLKYELATEDSNLGTYKGVFTTNNSEYRAIVNINLPLDQITKQATNVYPIASITLNTGDTFIARSTTRVENGLDITNLEFSSKDLSFTFSVNSDGTNPVVNNVVFLDLESAILIAKHSSKAPVVPITGTYECTVCNDFPGMNIGETQTFNMIYTGAGSGTTTMTTQVVLGGQSWNGIGKQDTCSTFGNFDTCQVASGDAGTDVGFTVLGGAVKWEGTHRYNKNATNPNDCSGAFGTWNYQTTSYGILAGTFDSDAPCYKRLYNRRFQAFRGLGFEPNGANGKLNSNIIKVNGMSDGAMAWGDTKLSGDFARGLSTGGVSTGGIYAFNTGNGNYAFGVQPGGSDFTPGDIDFRIVNNTGMTVNEFFFSYTIFVNNDQNRSNSLNFSYSTDGVSYTPVAALNYTSPVTADGLGFVKTKRSTTVNATVAAGSYIYLRFSSDDVAGSGSRDEIAIDNVRVQGI
ncbi:hypothetical protein [Ulvibacter antarcticus]|uniref:Uncharacterized protein n=1 Tax=Ulvibacter antarcticus TaxID=442714 RepID=A0A3L9YHZ3_9FLAO|nr:hypothetical protein [Ulvibacter antarcticus]RMA59010.1 hypothetical protein BXY75_2392 [Ulvibacter antarcticus]